MCDGGVNAAGMPEKYEHLLLHDGQSLIQRGQWAPCEGRSGTQATLDDRCMARIQRLADRPNQRHELGDRVLVVHVEARATKCGREQIEAKLDKQMSVLCEVGRLIDAALECLFTAGNEGVAQHEERLSIEMRIRTHAGCDAVQTFVCGVHDLGLDGRGEDAAQGDEELLQRRWIGETSEVLK